MGNSSGDTLATCISEALPDASSGLLRILRARLNHTILGAHGSLHLSTLYCVGHAISCVGRAALFAHFAPTRTGGHPGEIDVREPSLETRPMSIRRRSYVEDRKSTFDATQVTDVEIPKDGNESPVPFSPLRGKLLGCWPYESNSNGALESVPFQSPAGFKPS
jgi:hypothetical protein